MASIRYGDRVIVRDQSHLNGHVGIVYKIVNNQLAHVLLDREVIWPVNIEQLEPVLPPAGHTT
ncbi:MAG: hypothetical protein RQ723_09430 [Desulfuromonadales bacterium]|nr:hypothetical protein [Desulfuromonadales bacterium]